MKGSLEVVAMWVALAISLSPGVYAIATSRRLGADSSFGFLLALFAASQLLRSRRP
jgi:hypothetical protein